jgi:two-component system cell cycle sensor histidine kinase/response regulator CckA
MMSGLHPRAPPPVPTAVSDFAPLPDALAAPFDHFPQPVLVLDAGRRVRYVNPAARALTAPDDDPVGQVVWARYPTLEGSRLQREYERVIQRGDATTFEEYRPELDRWFTVSASPYDGGLIAVVHDITAQKRTEAALERLRDELGQAQRIAKVGSWVWEVTTGEVRWSDETYRIFGHEPGTVTPSFELVVALITDAHDRERYMRTVEAALAGEVPFDVETRGEVPNVGLRIVHAKAEIERDATGAPIRMLGVVRDVTEQRLAEEALQRSEETLRLAQQAARVGTWSRSLHDGAMEWSDTCREMIGGDEDWVCEPLEVVHPEDRPMVETAWERARTSPGVERLRHRIVRLDGAVRHVDATVLAVHDRHGEPERLVGTVEDVTERLEAERERLALEQRVQQSRKLESLGVLAGGIAHDFNNLLVGVLGNASLLLGDLPPDAPYRQQVQEIETSARRLSDLTRQLLAYAGKGQVRVQSVDVAATIGHALDDAGAYINGNTDVVREIAGDLPRIRVDHPQLRHALAGLIANAIDAMAAIGDRPARRDRLTVRARSVTLDAAAIAGGAAAEGARPGRFVQIAVRDSGVGMDDATQARMFEPFFSTKFTGRGLSLAATHGMVRAHGGLITVESTPDVGTTIALHFPAEPDGAADAST